MSLSNKLTKHLTGQGQAWHKFQSLATFAYNTFYSPNLENYSPFELTLGREPKIQLDLETDPDTKVSGTYKGLPYITNKKVKILTKHAAKLQGKAHSPYKQR